MASWRRFLTTLIVAAFLVGYGPVGAYAGAVGTGPDPVGSTPAGAIDTADATDSHGAVDPSRPLSDIPGVEDDDGNDTDGGLDADGNNTDGGLDGGNNATDDATEDADETTDDAEETTDETTDDAEEAADETTDDAEEAADETTDDADEAVEETTDDTTESTEGTISDTTGEVGETVAETGDDLAEATGKADDLEADVTDTTTAVTDAEDGSVAGIAGQVANTAEELDPVTAGAGESVESSLERVTSADQVVETTPSVDAFDSPGITTSDGSTAAGNDASNNEAAVVSTDDSPGDSDERDDGATDGGGVPLPDSGTGSGIAAGTVLIGAALIARSTGTAAVLSAFGGSGGSLLGALLSVLRDWVGRLLGIFGYKRYSDDDPLAHGTREQLYEFIRDAPGSYLAEISNETGVTMGTVRYHLRILEFENLVTSEEIRGRRRYVPVGTDWAELEAALHDETPARILEALERGGPASVSGLADRLDRDPSTISHHLDRLADDGIVERERDGRAVVNKLADSARIALEDDATAPGRAPVSSGAD